MSDMFPSGWWIIPVIYLSIIGLIIFGIGILIGKVIA